MRVELAELERRNENLMRLRLQSSDLVKASAQVVADYEEALARAWPWARAAARRRLEAAQLKHHSYLVRDAELEEKHGRVISKLVASK